MVLAEMRERLIDLIQYDSDYDPNRTNSHYNRLINDAYIEACRVCELPEDTRSFSVSAGQRRVSVPQLIKAYRVYWNTLPLMRHVRPRENRLLDTGTPMSAEQVGTEILLYPIPDGDGILIVEGVYEPAPLVNDNDTPILPTIAHRAIVKLAFAQYLERLGRDKVEERKIHESEARAMLEEVVRELRVQRWGENRTDTYQIPFWLRGDW